MSQWEERNAFMDENGITRCPQWCVQPENEHEEGAHHSHPITFETVDKDQVALRVRASFYDTTDNVIFMQVTPDEDGEVALNFTDMQRLVQIGEQLMEMVESFWTLSDSPWKEAYPGSAADEE